MDAFISYNHQDQAYADHIKRALENIGYNIETAQDFLPGSNWIEIWQQKLRDAPVLILLMSPASLASLYVTQEWGYFMLTKKPIIPILLSDVQIAPALQIITYLDARSNGVDDLLIEKIVDVLESIAKQSNEIRFQFESIDVMTPDTMARIVMPYIQTLSNIEHITDEILGHKPGLHRIREISQNSPFQAVIEGLGKIAGFLYKRLSEEGKQQLRDEQATRTEERRIKRSQSQLEALKSAEEYIKFLGLTDLSTDERLEILTRLAPEFRLLYSIPVELRQVKMARARQRLQLPEASVSPTASQYSGRASDSGTATH